MSANFEVGLNVEVNGAASIEKFKKSLGDLAKNSEKVTFSQNDTRNGVTKLVAAFKNLDAADAKLIRKAMDKTNGNAKYVKSVKSVESATDELTSAVKNNSKAVEHNTDSTKSNEKAQEQETESTKKSAKETKAATRELEKKANALDRVVEETRRYEAAKKHLEDRERIMTEAHKKRQSVISRNANYIQGRVEETDSKRAASQQGVIASQTNAAQIRHNNTILRQQASHQLLMQRMQANHQNVLQRMAVSGRNGGGGMFGGRGSVGTGAGFVGNVNSLPGVGKVIVYDALRRILTNIYQTVGKVGDEIVQWTKDSIQFNDEMARAQTVFRGFGLIGQKNADGKSMSIADARANPAMGTSMMKIDKFSEKMMNTMTDLSMMTGQDTEEIVASARQLTADLINKKSGPGGKSPILDDKMGNELVATTEAMVGLAAVLKASDPGGRALKFHMVGLQELFSGSSGNSKDKGMANVKSLMLREGIRIKEKEAAPIAAAVNKGDITKASELIQEVLDRAGQSTITFKNLLANTLMPNIDAIKTAFKKLSGVFHQPLFELILDQAIRYREIMRGLMKSDAFNALMKKYGVDFKKAFFPIIAPISDFFDKIKNTNGDSLRPYIKTFLSVTRNFNIIFANFITGVVGFFNGLLGIDSKKKFDSGPMIKFSAQFAASGEQMGETLRTLSEKLSTALEPVLDQFFPAMIAVGDVFIAITKLISPFTRALAALAYEITNMPGIGGFIKMTMEEDQFKEMKGNLYDYAYTDGKDTNNFDSMGAGIAGVMSPVKLMNFIGSLPFIGSGDALVDANGQQVKTPWGTDAKAPMAIAEFYNRNEAPYGTVDQKANARVADEARRNYEQTDAFRNEQSSRQTAFARVAAALERFKNNTTQAEGGLMPGGRGYQGPSKIPGISGKRPGVYDVPPAVGKRQSLYDAPKPSNQNRPNPIVRPGAQNDAKVKAAEVSEKSINAIKNVLVKHNIAKVDQKGDFSFTKEHSDMLTRLKTGAPTQKDLAFTSEYKETILKTQTETKKETVVSSDLQKTIDSMNKSFNSNVNKDGTPKVDRTREIIKQMPLIVPGAADPVNKMPAPVNMAMNMPGNLMSFYGKMTTPSKAPYDMPKPTIPKVEGISEKDYITVANKVVAEKLKAINKPFIVKPNNMSETTNINIGTINMKSDNAKDFVDRLKGVGGNKTPVPYAPGFDPNADYNTRRNGGS